MLLDTSKARITVPRGARHPDRRLWTRGAQQQDDQCGQEEQRREVAAQPAGAGGGASADTAQPAAAALATPALQPAVPQHQTHPTAAATASMNGYRTLMARLRLDERTMSMSAGTRS
jgi:hypothetical protein